MKEIAFIGLGIMGKPMAKNLLKAGYGVTVFDIVPSAVAELVAAGAKGATSCASAASQGEYIITMLPDGPDVEKAVNGPGGILEGARPGTVLIDMSSISPVNCKRVASACAERKIK